LKSGWVFIQELPGLDPQQFDGIQTLFGATIPPEVPVVPRLLRVVCDNQSVLHVSESTRWLEPMQNREPRPGIAEHQLGRLPRSASGFERSQ